MIAILLVIPIVFSKLMPSALESYSDSCQTLKLKKPITSYKPITYIRVLESYITKYLNDYQSSYYFYDGCFAFQANLAFYYDDFKWKNISLDRSITSREPNYFYNDDFNDDGEGIVTEIKFFIIQTQKKPGKKKAMALAYQRFANLQIEDKIFSNTKKPIDIPTKERLRINAEHAFILEKNIQYKKYRYFKGLMYIKDKTVIIIEGYGKKPKIRPELGYEETLYDFTIQSLIYDIRNSFLFIKVKPDSFIEFYKSGGGHSGFFQMQKHYYSRMQEEKKHFLKAVEIDPSNYIAHYYLGSLYEKIDTDKSKEHYQIAKKIHPQYALYPSYEEDDIDSMLNRYERFRGKVVPISINSTTKGSLAFDEIDSFRLDVPSSGFLSAHTTGKTDTVGRIYNSSKDLIASNHDGDDDEEDLDYNFEMKAFLTKGVHYIQVEGHYGDVQPYTLHTSFTPANSSSVDSYGNLIDEDEASPSAPSDPSSTQPPVANSSSVAPEGGEDE